MDVNRTAAEAIIPDPARPVRGRALVVDDDATNRLVLRSLLHKAGFDVLLAEDGAQAVACFAAERPDIIFMDAMMPVMDGCEAAARIKTQAGSDFVPIIFLAALTDDDALARCIEAGGDDFLAKPVNNTLLQAKIRSMERIRDLHREVAGLNRRMQQDEEIAERILNGAVTRDNVVLDHIRTLLRPAAVFSGDMLLTAHAPSRDLHVLLADFSGHGLSAALGALPASEVFRAMTAKGFPLHEVLKGINGKLHHLLPSNMFMAAAILTISHDLGSVTVCNCGMPDVLIFAASDGSPGIRIPSSTVPLGIRPHFDARDHCRSYALEPGDRILLLSDGIIEARNPAGEQFGEARLLDALASAPDATNGLERVARALDAFCGDAPQSDDISLVEIPCGPAILPAWDMETLLHEPAGCDCTPGSEGGDAVQFDLVFEGRQLRTADPVPLVINYVRALVDSDIPCQVLFTILTELYVNALDHGVLGLDSVSKSDLEGFERYFMEREKRLAALEEGRISISLRYLPRPGGGHILLQVEDSGEGFDYRACTVDRGKENLLHGRGIHLVRQLCRSLCYEGRGNRVVAEYRWDGCGDGGG